MIPPGKIIGILGGGQLGRMIAMAAADMGYRTHVYCQQRNEPAAAVARFVTCASFHSTKDLAEFAEHVDIVTLEFENVPSEALKIIENYAAICPGWKALHVAQNRLREKEFVTELGIETVPFMAVKSMRDLEAAYSKIGPDTILKTAEEGYDGKGQMTLKAEKDFPDDLKAFSDGEMVLEKRVVLKQELSVIIGRSAAGDVSAFSPFENIHKNGVLHKTHVPANISASLSRKAIKIATALAEALEVVGLLTVEFFIDDNDRLYVNELAPRPHNSGHITMDACLHSQFEHLIRAICGLPFGDTKFTHKAVMTNLIGADVEDLKAWRKDPKAKCYLYGKNQVKPGRKMGHVNKCLSSL